jgi:hypothetical protein
MQNELREPGTRLPTLKLTNNVVAQHVEICVCADFDAINILVAFKNAEVKPH